MIPKSVTDAFWELLRAGLWNTLPEDSYFPLSDDQWKGLYRLSAEQTVQGIVFDGIMKLPVECLPAKELLVKWTVAVDGIERRNLAMNKVASELSELFSKKSIEVLLLKGQGVASYYVNPLHRVCGDIDWCFLSEAECLKANMLIESCGKNLYAPELSSNYVWEQIEVEHHSRMIDINNPFCGSYIQELLNNERKNMQALELDGVFVKLPSPLLAMLCVNAHILKHLLGLGIGLRQLCDSARVYFANKEFIDGAHLEETYRRLGMHKWIQLLHQLLVDYIGMPEACLPFPLKRTSKADWLISEILLSGNFGHYDQRFVTPESSAQLQKASIVRRYIRSFGNYFALAPTEAFWLPLIKLSARTKKLMQG